MTPFIKDYLAYFTDHELTDYDIKRLNEIHERHCDVSIVEKPVKEIVYRNRVIVKPIPIVPGLTYRAKPRTASNLNELRQNAIDAIIDHWGCNRKTIYSRSRRRDYVLCRYHVFLELRNMGLSLQAIGDEFSRDHTSVMHGLESAFHMLQTGWEPFKTMVQLYESAKQDMQQMQGEESIQSILLDEKEGQDGDSVES